MDVLPANRYLFLFLFYLFIYLMTTYLLRIIRFLQIAIETFKFEVKGDYDDKTCSLLESFMLSLLLLLLLFFFFFYAILY